MPMSHKAFAFDWQAFQRDELPGLLSRALETGDPSGVLAYVERNRAVLKEYLAIFVRHSTAIP